MLDQTQWIHQLVTEYEKPLCRYARSMCGDDATARDAVQETFLRLCKTHPEKIEGHEAAWLFRVCRTRVLDLRKKEKPMTHLHDGHAAGLTDSGPTPDEQSARKDSESHIPSLLNALPERQQEAVRLKFQQNLSYRQIAEVLEITESNVGFILHTALNTLRNDMNQLQGVQS